MKLLKRLIVVAVLLVVLLVAGVALFFDSLVRVAIEKGGTYAVETPVRVESVDASPFAGSFELRGLAIENPQGFRAEPFLALGGAAARWDGGTVTSARLVVEELRVEGLALNLERGPERSNFGVILDSLGRLASKAAPSTGGGTSSGGGAQPAGAERHLEVRRIVVKDLRTTCRVNVLGQQVPDVSVVVPEFVVEGFATDGSTTEIVAKLLDAIVRAALEASAKNGGLPTEFTRDLKGRLDSLRAQIESNLGGSVRETLKGVGGALEGAGKGLEGLLKKPK